MTTIEWSWSVIGPPTIIDVHQHLWPPTLIEALRGLDPSGPVRLDGWTLHLPGEPPYEVDPAHHELARRVAQEERTATALVSLSSPLGIEDMHPDVALPLLAAWHDGAASLPAPFRAWAAVHSGHPDLADLERRLGGDFAACRCPPPRCRRRRPSTGWLRCSGSARPQTSLSWYIPARSRWVRIRAIPRVVAGRRGLHRADDRGLVVLVRRGRSLLPGLRICFAAGAGLAPVHHERFTVRGGGNPPPIDRLSFVETSSYGPRGLDALIRVLGIDVVVNGTDKPYASTSELRLGDAADRAVRVVDPRRLLGESGPR